MRRLTFSFLLLSAWSLAACGDDPEPAQPVVGPPTEDRLLDDPLGELPTLLSQVGVYEDMVDRGVIDPRAIPYTPAFGLWSSASTKERFLVLPPGTAIENPPGERWSFPTGTLLFKTFSFVDAAGQERPVETRLMRFMEDGDWDYGVWRWNETGVDADLLDLKKTVPVTITDATGASFEYVIPNRLQCRKCHEADPSIVLGISELQLAAAVHPQGGSALDDLETRGALADPVPAEPEHIVQTDELTRWVVGYAHGNCVHCHNGLEGPANSFDLHHTVFIQNTVGAETKSTWGIGLRVVPGDPGESMLFVGMSGETDDIEIKDMPPLGVAVRDTEAIENYRAWIAGLTSDEGFRR